MGTCGIETAVSFLTNNTTPCPIGSHFINIHIPPTIPRDVLSQSALPTDNRTLLLLLLHPHQLVPPATCPACLPVWTTSRARSTSTLAHMVSTVRKWSAPTPRTASVLISEATTAAKPCAEAPSVPHGHKDCPSRCLQQLNWLSLLYMIWKSS